MQSGDNWRSELQRNIAELNEFVETTSDFSRRLAGLCRLPGAPVSEILYTIDLGEKFSSVELGFRAQRNADTVKTIPLGTGLHAAKLEYWRQTENGSTFDVETVTSLDEGLINLLEAFWRPDTRATKSRLPAVQQFQDVSILRRSISKFLQRYEVVSLLFLDLDHFKQVNDTLSGDKGDEVLLDFGALVTEAVSNDGVPLHFRTGDEFIVIVPSDSLLQTLNVGYRVARKVASHDFDVGEINLTNCVGIASVTRGVGIPDFNEFATAAQQAVKLEGGNKLRDRARFASPFQTKEVSQSITIQVKHSTSLCLIRSCVSVPEPFASPWLNLISDQVFETATEPEKLVEVTKKIEALLDWVKPQWDEQFIRSALRPENEDLQPRFSHYDVAMAVAHGVTRAILDRRDCDWPDAMALKILPNKKTKNNWSLEFTEGLSETLYRFEAENLPYDKEGFSLGFVPRASEAATAERTVNACSALLIRIGHDPIDLPDSLFAEKIVVDDRPTRGGGLPDFWEATVARLVAAVERFPNVTSVFVLGESEYGAQTIARLKGLATWAEPQTIDKLQYKTAMSAPAIRETADRLKDGVYLPESTEELINKLSVILLEHRELLPCDEQVFQQVRFLTRHLDTQFQDLGGADGCRVRTIAQAFPVVLEIMRNSAHAVIQDQAGKDNYEIIDYRVELEKPEEEMVPVFYHEEQSQLDKYFNDVFIEENGLFASRLNEGNQVDAVLQHLVKAINSGSFATRRAILIVPHNITEGKDITPLGLVSVRIIPRFEASTVTLHYSYTWRTVESMVGFPYSIYGSVRYSKHLTESVEKLLAETGSNMTMRMGKISYIAHSLHMFVDDYGQNIARNIINDVTN